MKILEINKFHFPKGGADKHFLDVCELLEADGHRVARFCMLHENNLPSEWEEYFVSKVGYTAEYSLVEKLKGVFRMFYSFEAHRKINDLLDAFKPDLVHVHNIYHQLDPTVLFEVSKRKIPIVMTVHDYKIINPNHALTLNGLPYGRCRGGKYYQCFFDKCVKGSYGKSFLAMLEMYWHKLLGTYEKNVDLYLAPSEYVKTTLVNWGVGKEKIKVLAHFITDGKKTGATKNPEENRLDLKKCALYAGRISKEKGVSALIDIFKELPESDLRLAGACEDGFEIPQDGNLKYLGFLKQEYLATQFADADFVVSASELPETFGLIALEAISHGKPFFGIDTGAFSEIIKNGENGYLAKDKKELQQAVKYFLQGVLLFDNEKIRKNALEKYAAEKYAAEIKNIFEDLAKK